ncbi:cysteine desulfurase [Cryomorpha ignava]|uniref:Cysteine desulfurase n=1 Tax=Cryomorpha ignava TaxID=101383 RepID=A0A7K3WTU0_9FLAO|nr:cysteine desulfurase [Cryomorpha ignava]NEN25103.1 cysteine desulfurase [Cryomorpha ignava]
MNNLEAKTVLENEAIRAQFPILKREVNGHKLVYLDNAASSQKPKAVLDAIVNYYSFDHSNVHRGVHFLSQLATEKYEAAREKMRGFINAKSTKEVLFTKGTTEGINLVSYGLSRSFLKPGDEILISEMEHHSNIVPWQIAAADAGAKLVVVNVLEDGSLCMDDFRKKLSDKTKLVSIVHVSNALGTINPVKEITQLAHEQGALVLIDGAQAAPHQKVDVQDIDCDFYVISGHKMYGPTGSGILYGKEAILNEMPPYQAGGEMIKNVSFEETTYNELPFKFEAGTPNVEAAIGLSAAVDFMEEIGFEKLTRIEQELVAYAHERLSEVEGIRFIGTAPEKASVVSFIVEGTHPTDIGTIIDKLGIAVRTGHHCTQPLMDKFGLPGTVRASFAVYNTLEEIDLLTDAVKRAVKMLK